MNRREFTVKSPLVLDSTPPLPDSPTSEYDIAQSLNVSGSIHGGAAPASSHMICVNIRINEMVAPPSWQLLIVGSSPRYRRLSCILN